MQYNSDFNIPRAMAESGQRHIGLDFDNTIVCYDQLFHRVALDAALIPADLPVSKLAVRQHIRDAGLEKRWTEIQGVVYGARMDEAVAYPGVIDFIRQARQSGHRISIVSHKTRHPVIGPKHDLPAAASRWITQHLVDDEAVMLASEDIHFLPTRAEKIAVIADIQCELFIDDLPEVFAEAAFPGSVQQVLFDPDNHHLNSSCMRFDNWQAISKQILAPDLA